jgi:hypothetical protein
MKWNRFRRTSGGRAVEAAFGLPLALGLALALGACNYGLEGGGCPAHIRTIYIAPFTNETPQFDLDQQVYARLLDELPRRLGVRVVGEEAAAAIVTGAIARYDDVAQSYQGAGGQPGMGGGAHEVQISISIRIVDVRDNVIRWEAQRLTGRGIYRSGEPERIGQDAAISNLVEQIIDGAQSQW